MALTHHHIESNRTLPIRAANHLPDGPSSSHTPSPSTARGFVMANSVGANKMSVVTKDSKGVTIAFPDVCKT
ncbi:MAG: hypothetical protein EOO70_05670, partial [Myxococcaceae bacterium]